VDVLVTGGNGFVGRHLVDALLARGDRVRVLALPREDASSLEQRGVVVHRGDVRRPETLIAPVHAAEAVVHLAAMMDVWRPLHEYAAVNVTGTENMCRAALVAGVDRFVHMSSSSVYGMDWRMPVGEDCALCPFPDPYPVTKTRAERVVQRMITEGGLPATIIRPDQIFGPGDRLHFARTADRVRSGRAIVVGHGDNRLPLVYVADAVQGLLLGLDHPQAVGGTFNIANDEPFTQLQFLSAVADAIGAKPPRVHVPYRVAYGAACVAERMPVSRYTWRRPPLTRLGVAFAGRDVRFAIERARATLGYAPRVPLAEGIERAAAWYRSVPTTGPANVAPSPTRISGVAT